VIGVQRSLFEAAGGDPAILDLARAWHRRCLADPVVSHAFSHGQHPDHVERLAAYWAEALGGPAGYSGSLGDHSEVLRLHSGNGEHAEMDERAQVCFALALDDAGLPDDERLRGSLKGWFRWATSGMAAYPESAQDVPGRAEGAPLVVGRTGRAAVTGPARLARAGEIRGGSMSPTWGEAARGCGRVRRRQR
jgi:hemoglobin